MPGDGGFWSFAGKGNAPCAIVCDRTQDGVVDEFDGDRRQLTGHQVIDIVECVLLVCEGGNECATMGGNRIEFEVGRDDECQASKAPMIQLHHVKAADIFDDHAACLRVLAVDFEYANADHHIAQNAIDGAAWSIYGRRNRTADGNGIRQGWVNGEHLTVTGQIAP